MVSAFLVVGTLEITMTRDSASTNSRALTEYERAHLYIYLSCLTWRVIDERCVVQSDIIPSGTRRRSRAVRLKSVIRNSLLREVEGFPSKEIHLHFFLIFECDLIRLFSLSQQTTRDQHIPYLGMPPSFNHLLTPEGQGRFKSF